MASNEPEKGSRKRKPLISISDLIGSGGDDEAQEVTSGHEKGSQQDEKPLAPVRVQCSTSAGYDCFGNLPSDEAARIPGLLYMLGEQLQSRKQIFTPAFLNQDSNVTSGTLGTQATHFIEETQEKSFAGTASMIDRLGKFDLSGLPSYNFYKRDARNASTKQFDGFASISLAKTQAGGIKDDSTKTSSTTKPLTNDQMAKDGCMYCSMIPRLSSTSPHCHYTCGTFFHDQTMLTESL
jgi:hypothetical protein